MQSNMTTEQIERYLRILEDKNAALENIAYSINDNAAAIRGSYTGTETSAFWGISQALFSMVDSDRNGDGLKIIINKDGK